MQTPIHHKMGMVEVIITVDEDEAGTHVLLG